MSDQQRSYIGIDPGTTDSGWACIGEGGEITGGIMSNGYIVHMIYSMRLGDLKRRPGLAIERLRGTGRAVGFETIRTIEWSGRFIEAYNFAACEMPRLITRHEILKALGVTRGSGSADSRVRAKMVEIYGEPGTAKNPGPTYGITGHAWQALAVAHVAKIRS